jgi:hypothetical protein
MVQREEKKALSNRISNLKPFFRTAELRIVDIRKISIWITAFLITTITILSSLSTFDTFGQGEQLGTSPLFPNATSKLPGVPTIVPGLHVMSLVNGIKSTWLIISSDNELSLNLRYTGTGTTPAVSLFATALKNTTLGQQGTLSQNQSFQRLTGSNVTNAGWVSPLTVPIRLKGDMSLYDADLIIVMIVPLNNNTIGSNATTASIPASTPAITS